MRDIDTTYARLKHDMHLARTFFASCIQFLFGGDAFVLQQPAQSLDLAFLMDDFVH